MVLYSAHQLHTVSSEMQGNGALPDINILEAENICDI
jgi:hypothetical protein